MRMQSLLMIDAYSGNETIIPLSVTSPQPELQIKTDAWFELDSWLADGLSIIGLADTVTELTDSELEDGYSDKVVSINSQTGVITPVVSFFYDSFELSPHENYLTFKKQTSSLSDNEYELKSVRSLLNLAADLRLERDGSVVLLEGIAQDLHFESYRLEYVDIENPGVWHLICPPSDIPVVNDTLAQWIPPYTGTFYIRLTVQDKAGNVAWSRKRISWGQFSSITSLYKSEEIFSPNGDGIKDSVDLHYRVLEPVHLNFFIYDEENTLIKDSFQRSTTSSEESFITWDGTDESGGIVPDGIYALHVFDYKFFVKVDNTPPIVDLELSRIEQRFEKLPKETEQSRVLVADLLGYADDLHLKGWQIEWGEGHNPHQWYEFSTGTEPLGEEDEEGTPELKQITKFIESEFEVQIVGKKFKITAEDFAGNKSTVIADFLEMELVLYEWDKEILNIARAFVMNEQKPVSIGLRETIRETIESLTIQYTTFKLTEESLVNLRNRGYS